MRLPPPKPVSIEFMKRPEDDWNILSPGSFEVGHENSNFIEPGCIQIIFFSSGEDRCNSTWSRIPRRFTGERIIQVPADGDHATAIVCFANKSFHPVERNRIKILFMIELQSSQFKSIYGGVITGDVPDVTPALFIFPTHTICRIILVSEHDAVLQKFFQVVI